MYEKPINIPTEDYAMLTLDDLETCAKQVIEEAEWLDDNLAIPVRMNTSVFRFVEAARAFLEDLNGG